jgi:hypothetical protein
MVLNERTPWAIDNLYTFQCKTFHNARHIATLDYHCKALFETPCILNLLVYIYYLPVSCNICYENKFYGMNIGQSAAIYLLYHISKVRIFLSAGAELVSARFARPVNMSGLETR